MKLLHFECNIGKFCGLHVVKATTKKTSIVTVKPKLENCQSILRSRVSLYSFSNLEIGPFQYNHQNSIDFTSPILQRHANFLSMHLWCAVKARVCIVDLSIVLMLPHWWKCYVNLTLILFYPSAKRWILEHFQRDILIQFWFLYEDHFVYILSE